jgi:Bacterial PH domain
VVVLRPSRWLSLPKYLGTLGMYGFWRKRHTYVLTNQRMLLGKGIFVRTERSLPINQIEDAAFVRRGAGAYCEVTVRSHGRMRTDRVGPLSARSARRLTAEIQARI